MARAYAMYALLVAVVLLGQAAASAGLRDVKWEAPWPGSYAVADDGQKAPLVYREPPVVPKPGK